jgi:hypothetical protein
MNYKHPGSYGADPFHYVELTLINLREPGVNDEEELDGAQFLYKKK